MSGRENNEAILWGVALSPQAGQRVSLQSRVILVDEHVVHHLQAFPLTLDPIREPAVGVQNGARRTLLWNCDEGGKVNKHSVSTENRNQTHWGQVGKVAGGIWLYKYEDYGKKI